MRILLNGVGRIGKAIVRIAQKSDLVDIVAINEQNTNIENIAYNINYDSTYGRFDDLFEHDTHTIYNSKSKIKILCEKSLEDIDFQQLQIDAIIDASGSKVDISMLKRLSVRAIFLTHPNNQADINIILGANEEALLQEHKIIATSSCNASALLPALTLLDKHYGIECGEITTIHPYLNHQKLLDGNCIGSTNRQIACNFEFGRSATQNIIPSKTTTIEACSYVASNINANLIASSSMRVPTDVVGVIDVTMFLRQKTTKEALVALFQTFEQKQKYPIITNNFAPLVSSDFKALPYSTIIDHRFSDVKCGKMVKLAIWYDNEWGYASKVVAIAQLLCE